MNSYKKDFDKWIVQKKHLDSKERFAFASNGEIWWASIGQNVGVEIDGKNDNFERPVIILKVFNPEMLCIVPLTTKKYEDKFHVKVIDSEEVVSYAVLTQTKLISAKRLLRKIGKVSFEQVSRLRTCYTELFIQSKSRTGRDSSEPSEKA